MHPTREQRARQRDRVLEEMVGADEQLTAAHSALTRAGRRFNEAYAKEGDGDVKIAFCLGHKEVVRLMVEVQNLRTKLWESINEATGESP